MDLTDENAVPTYMKISKKVLHLRRLGMSYPGISERADEIFTKLMSDQVEPRREFIEKNTLDITSLDI